MSPYYLSIGVAALLISAATLVWVRLRGSRDRGRIRDDLNARRCKFVAARRTRRASLGGQTTAGRTSGRRYDVEFVDLDDDPAVTNCIISRASIDWADDAPSPGSGTMAIAGELPTYGQNWRG